jgi:hypothetical protein
MNRRQSIQRLVGLAAASSGLASASITPTPPSDYWSAPPSDYVAYVGPPRPKLCLGVTANAYPITLVHVHDSDGAKRAESQGMSRKDVPVGILQFYRALARKGGDWLDWLQPPLPSKA